MYYLHTSIPHSSEQVHLLIPGFSNWGERFTGDAGDIYTNIQLRAHEGRQGHINLNSCESQHL